MAEQIPKDTRPLKKRISHVLEYGFVRFLSIVIYPIPFGWLDRFAATLVFLFNPFLGSSKKRIIDNIRFAYPEWDQDQIKKFVQANLRNTVRIFFEVYQSRKLVDPKVMQKHVRWADTESITMVTQRPKGIVCLQGHFGNWEIGVIKYSHEGVSIPFSLKRLSNPYVNKMTFDTRMRYGGTPVYMEDSDQLVRQLRKGAMIGLVADQDAGREGVFAEFFGRKASCFQGPALLAYICQAPITLATCVYEGRGKYLLINKEIHPPVNKSDYKSRDEAIQQITQVWCKALEAEIRKRPEQYFWVHRRWKTRPPEERGQA